MNTFPENSRVCFCGDSITHANLFVSRIVDYYNTNFKERNVKFYNCGVSGGSLYALFKIFDDDIAVHNPTHACIMIGMNDCGRWMLDEPRGADKYNHLLAKFEDYKKKLSEFCEKLENMGTKIILCTPTPYDEYQDSETAVLKGGFALLGAYAEYVRNFAREKGYDLCDFHPYISEMAQKEAVIRCDRVHPTELGHYYMAKHFLASQGEELGENKDLPEYMNEWREKVAILRNIRAAEYLIIRDYSLTTEERIEFTKQYLETCEDNYFRMLSENYIANKEKQTEIEARVDEIMENGFYL